MVWLYFALVSGTKLALFGFIFLLCCLIRCYSWKKAGQVLLILSVFAAYLSFHQWQGAKKNEQAPQTIQSIQILPDTISINGDSLSFRGRERGQTYQAFYKLTSEE